MSQQQVFERLQAQAGQKKDAVEVVFNAADSPVIAQTPDFAKSLPLSKALDENTLIAFEMNGEPLPHWNGFPARRSCRVGRRLTGSSI